ncbi:Os04g0220300, partial [Oryza sativa Japonica Group]
AGHTCIHHPWLGYRSSSCASPPSPSPSPPPLIFPVPASNCPDKCGNVSIPYPFGIGRGCYLDLPGSGSFSITCNHKTDPPQPYTADALLVLNITLETAEMFVVSAGALAVVKYPSVRARSAITSKFITTTQQEEEHSMQVKVTVGMPVTQQVNMTFLPSGYTLSAPYRLSPTGNMFTAVGCVTMAKLYGSVENSSSQQQHGGDDDDSSSSRRANDRGEGVCVRRGLHHLLPEPERRRGGWGAVQGPRLLRVAHHARPHPVRRRMGAMARCIRRRLRRVGPRTVLPVCLCGPGLVYVQTRSSYSLGHRQHQCSFRSSLGYQGWTCMPTRDKL